MLVIGDRALLGMQPPSVSVQITCSGVFQLLSRYLLYQDGTTAVAELQCGTAESARTEQNIRIGGPAV